MINKERKKPLKVIKLEALIGRLPHNHPCKPNIEAELSKALAGWRGEQAIDYYLSFLPKENYIILRDLRLEVSENRFFQIDALLLAQNQHLILEVKNMAGTLYFNNEPQQLVQTINNEEKAYQCPILQVERQCQQLQTFFNKFTLPKAPILRFVVISHSNAVIKFAPKFQKARQCVIHSSALPEKINAIQSISNSEIISQKELKKLARLLVKHNQPLNPDYLERYNISVSELLTGVHCPNCGHLPMQRKRGLWFCPTCQHTSKDAHIAAIRDYWLLINSTITNRQLRDFLHLPSNSVATKLLTSLGLKKYGILRGSRYLLDKL